MSAPLDAFEGQFRRQERHKSKAPSGRLERNSCPRALFSPVSHAPVVSLLFYLSPLSLPLLISVPSVLNWLGKKGSPHVFSRLLLLSLAITLLAWASEKSEYMFSRQQVEVDKAVGTACWVSQQPGTLTWLFSS